MSFLRCVDLHKSYPDGTQAVRGVDLECAAGEFVVLLGPSGCGKTTTLRMVAGLETPTVGEIFLDGEAVSRRGPGERDVGFVFQFYALYPHMDVRENVAFPLRSIGLPAAEIRRRADEILGRLGLAALAGVFPGQLSGGDQQRVALARAMVRRPRLYLMDEPLGTLDAERRAEMRTLIRAQQLESGITTVYVTHDQEEAMHLADRIVVMRDGRIRQSGSPQEVYEEPADLFVAHFIGSPGMNFFEGYLEGGDFVAAGLRLPGVAAGAGAATLGVRPEFVLLDDGGPLRGSVVLDEYLGSCRNVHVDTACGRVVARLEGDGTLDPGATVGLAFAPGRARCFDPESGEALV